MLPFGDLLRHHLMLDGTLDLTLCHYAIGVLLNLEVLHLSQHPLVRLRRLHPRGVLANHVIVMLLLVLG